MFSPLELKLLTIITGHYGVGKTNLSMNFAYDLSQAHQAVSIIDLDIVNPYFRSSDYTELLENSGVNVIAPTFAGTTLDNPSLSPAIAGAFNQQGYVLIDVGGDDAGAHVLGRFWDVIQARDYDLLYVVNANRNLTSTVDEALDVLSEIEAACRLKATGIINNTHLMRETTCDTILEGEAFGEQVAEQAGLPLLCVTIPPDEDCAHLRTPRALQYPTYIYVAPPW